tara:strand:+ start:142 stop:726 length:585 start_codon:yes stop_codon:yes gene_type:complete
MKEEKVTLDRFLQVQIGIDLLSQISWCLIIPLIHKLQGQLWSASTIAAALVIQKSSGFWLPLFKGSSLRRTKGLSVIIGIGYVMCTALYWWNISLFLWSEVAICVAMFVNGSLFYIAMDLYLISNYGKDVFEHFKVLREVMKSAGGVSGYAFVAILYSFVENSTAMSIFIGMMSTVAVFQGFNYWLYFRKMGDV